METNGPNGRVRRAFSVRTRIVAVITLVSALAMLSVGVAVYVVERASILQNVDERLRANLASARFLVSEGEGTTGGWASSTDALRTVVQRMSPDANTGALGIVDGKAALAPGVPLDVDLQSRAFVDAIVAATKDGAPVIGTFSDEDATLRYLATPISVEGSPSPQTVVFAMAYDLDAELAEIDGAARVYLIATGIAVLVIAGVATIVATRLLRPLRQMRETAERVSAQSLSERLPVHGHDDVSQLAVTMNEMLDRLGGTLDSQRRLLGDVGHELKTPITIVQGYVEVMDAADPADVRETQRLVVDELGRMGGLVQDLAGAASLYGPEPISPRPVDTADLLRQIARKAAGIEGAEVSVGPVAEVAAQLDPTRITQAMLQLAQNAVTHGGGVMEMECRVVAGSLELTVRDHGPGVPEEAHARIFERFRRGTDAEGRSGRGSGLGLDIVRLIAVAHGGRALVRDAPGGGAEFAMVLPLRPAAGADRAAPTAEEGAGDGLHPHR